MALPGPVFYAPLVTTPLQSRLAHAAVAVLAIGATLAACETEAPSIDPEPGNESAPQPEAPAFEPGPKGPAPAHALEPPPGGHDPSPGEVFSWLDLFMAGEALGASGAPPDEADRQALALPQSQRLFFVDGYAHGKAWEEAAPQVQVATPREQISPEFLAACCNGLVIRFTATHPHEPDRVSEHAAGVAQVCSHEEPQVGVAIGLQRALGDDLDRMLEAGRAYSEDWWPALYEEFGWRVGEEHAADFGLVVAKEAAVPEAVACHYVHGAVRGAWEVRQTAGTAAEILSYVEATCRDAAWRGLAINLHKSGASDAQLDAWLEGVDEADANGIRGWIEALVQNPALHATPLWQLERRD